MMLIFLFIFLLIDNTHSFEWNCTKNKPFLLVNEQCTITVEYEDRQICLTHTLSISTLPSSSNSSLKIFRINFCQLVTLSQLSFSLPSSLETLDLRSNLLTTFTLALPLLFDLKYLYLDHNPDLIDLNFDIQENLIGLSLRHNQQIQLSSFPKSLIELDLTDCNLSHSILWRSLTKLTHLSLAENHFEQLPILDQIIQLEYLNLSNNHLTFLDETWLHKHLHILDLRYNQIKSLEFFQQRLKFNQTPMITLQLSIYGNPLTCNCWLGSPLLNITDLSFQSCPSQLCPYSRHCTFDCTCCDFEACDCHSICPSECLCSHDLFWSRHLVDCRQGNLSIIPMFLPSTITELNYEGNHIEQFQSFVLTGKNFLIKLNLARNNLRNITNETFCAATNLREIDLSFNRYLRNILSNIDQLFGCLKHLQYVILSKEQINDEEQMSIGWTIDYDEDEEEQRIRLSRMMITQMSYEPSTILYQELYTYSNIIQHHQTLILIVFFLLLFLLLFSLLLIALAICRRKIREHLTTELQRQRSQHYYYYHHQQPPSSSSMKIPESNNGTNAVNESLYEQLPSLSSDSEQPFLYNDNKLTSTDAPALPPYPPNLLHYQYTIHGDYSQQQCPAVLVTNNPMSLYPHVQR